MSVAKQKRNQSESDNKKKMVKIRDGDISDSFIAKCETEFKQHPENIIAKNAITSVGSSFSTIDSNRLKDISHIFLNSVKRKNVKATNQGASGRCWIFAALNMFRHIIIRVLNLENFEFSEVYLFFWDKFERANTYIRWFIDNPDAKPGDRDFDYMISGYNTSDGGWWNMVASLVHKYGLVPANAMRETFQSDDSDNMNQIIKEQLDSSVNYIINNRKKLSQKDLSQIRKTTLKSIYSTLVKFLGEPPKRFTWSFTNDDDESAVIPGQGPISFFNMVAPDIDLVNDFVVLAHLPSKLLLQDQNYRLRCTKNIYEGEDCTFFNTSIDNMSRYAIKSINAGLAVWVVGDVKQSFNWMSQALDDKLDAHTTVFPNKYSFEKGDRITMRNIQGNHAMCLTGYNVDDSGKPVSWQCENSWGYFEYDTPGMDGFLYMSHSWFEKYVVMIVVSKKLFSRTFRKKVEIPAIDLDPWDGMAPALKTDGRGVPENYVKFMKSLV